jgi:hypothetical protein
MDGANARTQELHGQSRANALNELPSGNVFPLAMGSAINGA